MAYQNIGQYVTAATLLFIRNLDGSPEQTLEVIDRVRSYAEGEGVVTEAQFDLIRQAMLDKLGEDVPWDGEPAQTEDGITLQDVVDGISELSGLVSEQGESIAVTDEAVAELSEIVSGLVPAEEE